MYLAYFGSDTYDLDEIWCCVLSLLFFCENAILYETVFFNE